MAHLYDLMLLIDATLPDDRREAIVGEVESLLASGGEIVGHHDWGSRKIAYEIDHRPEAEYHLFQFEAEPDLLDRANHTLRIADGILRHRIIRQLPGAPPPPPSPEPAHVAREDEPEGRVAARAAADAPPEPSGSAEDLADE
jgi:small subunit ribosomal protein S6